MTIRSCGTHGSLYVRHRSWCYSVQLQGGPRPLELAADGGVYENEPEVRTDVVRSDEFEPDVIPVAQMRSTRTMWARKELQHDQPAAFKQPEVCAEVAWNNVFREIFNS